MASSLKSKIFFENENVAIIHKSANILSVRSRFHVQYQEENVIDQFGNLLPVHRLDREVEGLLITAKNKKTQSICSSWFEKREIKKSYRALSCEVDLSLFGKLPFEVEHISLKEQTTFTWKSCILRGKKRSYSSPHGDRTETHAHLVGKETLQGLSLYKWELHPITGRSHQLRFELARHCHPILGDELYFAPLRPAYSPGIALVAQSLDFRNCPLRRELGLPEEISLPLSWENLLSRVQSSATLIAKDPKEA